MYYRGAQAAIIVYDITNRVSVYYITNRVSAKLLSSALADLIIMSPSEAFKKASQVCHNKELANQGYRPVQPVACFELEL